MKKLNNAKKKSVCKMYLSTTLGLGLEIDFENGKKISRFSAVLLLLSWVGGIYTESFTNTLRGNYVTRSVFG